jgi:dimethylglycine dehydrogenase
MALTQLLTERGGIQADLTVTLIEPGVYYVVSAAATETHDLAWLQAHLPEDGSVTVDNVTARTGVLTVAGPRSRELLQRISSADFANTSFPFLRARRVEIGKSPVLALRVSYVGELGWELHHPLEHQAVLYDLLFAAGDDLGLADFGYRALDSMRLEKAYRLWGVDMSADWTPLQAGLERFVAFDKGDFVGRDALLREREQGSTHSLACLDVDAGAADAHGYEPIWAGGDTPVAYVAAGGYGHTIGKSLALAYLPVAHAPVGTALEITIQGERRAATVTEQPLYDPQGARLLS